jgi:hypothetical protein
MPEEIGNGTRIALMCCLAAVAAAVGLVVFGIGKSLDDYGLERMESAGRRDFGEYGGRAVSGAEVKSAVSAYVKSGAGFLVRLKSDGNVYCYGAPIDTGAGFDMRHASDGIEYRANIPPKPAVASDGVTAYEAALRPDLLVNVNIKPLARTIDVSGQFRADPIIDASDNVIGIYFNQI